MQDLLIHTRIFKKRRCYMTKIKLTMMMGTLVLSLMGMTCEAGADGKANVVILATGGTIAGSADSEIATTGYRAGALDIDMLINDVPEIKKYANVTGEQILSLDSKDMSDADWLKLSKRVNELLSQKAVDGIVVTHGTDTLEETAYFLNLTVHSRKPVVLTGAMRPFTAISADGPMNLFNAVCLASNHKAYDRGVLVCLNGRIDSARNVTKTHTTSVDSFNSPLGPAGYMNNGAPTFYNSVDRRHAGNTEFDVGSASKLPYVKIIYGHANDDDLFVEAAIRAGVEGIVYAGTGNGSIHKDVEAALARASKAGIVVVRSTRVGGGEVIPAEQSYIDAGFLDGDSLNPQKCRILLQLALMKTRDRQKIQQMFYEY